MGLDRFLRAATPTLLVLTMALFLGTFSPCPAETCDCYDPWGWSLCETWLLDDPGEAMAVFCVPDGSGAPFTEARLSSGILHDATIVVRVVDDYADPCPNIPAEDIWVDVVPDVESRFVACPGGTIADGPTAPDGLTTISEPMAAGGRSDPAVDRLQVYVSGNSLPGPGHDIQVNSADINGDMMVDLTDIALFAQDFFGAYDFRSDFVWDQTLNLSDIGRLANAIGASCLPE